MPSLEQIVLEQVKLSARHTVLYRGILENATVSWWSDITTNNLILSLESRIWGKQIDHGSEHKTIMVPASWVSAFLIETNVGRFLARWFQPRYKHHTLCVNWQAHVTFPEWSVKVPDSMGKQIILINYDRAYLVDEDS